MESITDNAVEARAPPPGSEPPPKRVKSSYECNLCTSSYTEKRSLVRHMRTAHWREARVQSAQVFCRFCSKPFAREDIRKRHEKERHLEIRRGATTGSRLSTPDVLRDCTQPDGRRPFHDPTSYPTTLSISEVDDPEHNTGEDNAHWTLKALFPSERSDSRSLSDTPSIEDLVDTKGRTHTDSGIAFLTCSPAQVPTMEGRALLPNPERVDSMVDASPLLSSTMSEPAMIPDTESVYVTFGSNKSPDVSIEESVVTPDSDDVDMILTSSPRQSFTTDERAPGSDDDGIDLVQSDPRDSLSEQYTLPPARESIPIDDGASFVTTSSSFKSRKQRFESPFKQLKERLSLRHSGLKSRIRSRKTSACVLCKKPFGDTDAEIQEHLHKHAGEFVGSHACPVCQIEFVHEADLRMHEQAAAKGHCGHTFDHAQPCQGHHAPDHLELGLSDHERLKLWSSKILHWEQAQLQLYLDQVSSLLTTEKARPQSDSRTINIVSRMGSLTSLVSNLSFRSTPNPMDYPDGERDTNRHAQEFERLQDHNRVLDDLVSTSEGIDALLRAASIGDVQRCQQIVAAGIDEKDWSKFWEYKPLYLATVRGHQPFVEFVISLGADVNEIDMGLFYGSPLCAAAAMGWSSIVGLLLESGASVDLRGRFGTALHHATQEKRTEIVEILLHQGASVLERNWCNGTPLVDACKSGASTMAKVLMDHSASVLLASDQYDLALREAATRGHKSCVLELLQHGNATTRAQKRIEALISASQKRDAVATNLLFELGSPLLPTYALHDAIDYDHDLFDANVRLREGYGIDSEKLLRYFYSALERGDAEATRLCALAGSGIPSIVWEDALCFAVYHDNVPLVGALMDCQADSQQGRMITILLALAREREQNAMVDCLESIGVV